MAWYRSSNAYLAFEENTSHMFEVGLINRVSQNMKMEDAVHTSRRFMARSVSDRSVLLSAVARNGAIILNL